MDAYRTFWVEAREAAVGDMNDRMAVFGQQ